MRSAQILPAAFLFAGLAATPTVVAAPAQAATIDLSARRWLASQSNDAAPAVDNERLQVTIRVREQVDVARLDLWARDGKRFAGSLRRTPFASRVVLATVTRDELSRLATLPYVVRIEAGARGVGVPALEKTAVDVGASAVWRKQLSELPITGRGITVGLLDSGIDIFHPLFFRADGGYFNWRDVNGDGQFDPGTDAIDMNRDGKVTADETARSLNAVAYNPALDDAPILGSSDDRFDPGWDHVFVDTNANMVRDYGPGGGFSESTPGYGEPLLVPDDVNGNGRVDLGEKFVLLKTSKVRTYTRLGGVWRRGINLIDAPANESELATHGTSAATIVLGGQRGLSRLVGVAPDADLVVSALNSNLSSYAPALQRALAEGVDLVVSEHGAFLWTHLDGSTNYELMIDEMTAAGIPFVNPAGNLGEKGHHAKRNLEAGGNLTMQFEIPSGSAPQSVYVSVHWADVERDLAFSLRLADGAEGVVREGQSVLDDTVLTAGRDDSPRGTARFDIALDHTSGLPEGTYQLQISDPGSSSGEPVAVNLYTMDSDTFMGHGVRFVNPDEDHLVVFPATADTAIAATAYAGRDGDGFDYPNSVPQGVLRGYSSRGTRMDGHRLVDVAAPDNPVTATNQRPLESGGTADFGAYQVFSGTSGAGPHVAGVVALLRQAEPALSTEQIRARLRNNATIDDAVSGDAAHTREELWGGGKLNAYGAVYQATVAPNSAPTIAAMDVVAEAGTTFAIPIKVGDAESPAADLRVVVDADYDGTSDEPPALGDQSIQASLSEPGVRYMRIEVRDPQGGSARTLVRVTVEAGGGCGCRAKRRGGASSMLLTLFALALACRLRR